MFTEQTFTFTLYQGSNQQSRLEQKLFYIIN